ncbi:MAG: hypothetical protein RSD35_05450 [Oscillospiraceae bacterium]
MNKDSRGRTAGRNVLRAAVEQAENNAVSDGLISMNSFVAMSCRHERQL